MAVKEEFVDFIEKLQLNICDSLEQEDGLSVFREDRWKRQEGGGGLSRVLSHGKIFEKAGVNTSVVYGELPDSMARTLKVKQSRFFACGISLVLHPLNPMVPTVHANYRYFELYDGSGIFQDSWFGGGSDLSPYYIFREDGTHFHTTLKSVCDRFSPQWYPKFKDECDGYFVNRHRNNEMRGIGGIFYDYLRPDQEFSASALLEFSKAAGNAFLSSYLPIVGKRKDLPFSENQRFWQEIRRGRYVEFNLIHDRGTLFGLKTGGRTESILMSLPPRARWEYDYIIEPDSEEANLITFLKPTDWLNKI
jgi:coproporphyrinogen III oxidase